MTEERYRKQLRRDLTWFGVAVASILAYTVLALLDVSLLFIWPLLLVPAFAMYKLLTA